MAITDDEAPVSRQAPPLFHEGNMPSLAGATEWLNSEPPGPAELRGRAALVYFWTLTCISWLRVGFRLYGRRDGAGVGRGRGCHRRSRPV